MDKGKILVVDDDAFFRVLCSDILSNGGFCVKTASSGAEAVGLIDESQFDVVITDLVMPGLSGFEVLQRTKQHNTLTDVIVITGHGSMESAINALKSGAFDYIVKPLNEDELLHTVNSCFEKKKLLAENQEMRQSLKLFEVSKAVTATLDVNKLYNISLDALLQIIPADAGLIAFYEEQGTKLAIKAIRHMGLPAGEMVAAAFQGRIEKDPKDTGGIEVLSVSDLNAPADASLKDLNTVLAAPLTRNSKSIGYIFVLGSLGKDGYSHRDISSAAFIAEHASSAFDNAIKYLEAQEMAFIDSLTGLYNAKYLEASLDKELKRADRLMSPVTVLFLDLDNFKRINDTNDHLVGSRVLVDVGKILIKCVREVDTVIRYGGDEYVVILVDADYGVAMMVAERIRSSIESQHFLEDDSLDIRITASIGVATYPVHTKDKKELLKIADKAMYRAKDLSRNVVYLAPMPEGAKK